MHTNTPSNCPWYSRFAADLTRKGIPVEPAIRDEQVNLLGLSSGCAMGAFVEGVHSLWWEREQ